MRDLKTLVRFAIQCAVAVGLIGLAGQGIAHSVKGERCFGISKAGKNDCGTGNAACAGSAQVDKQENTFLDLPKGTCDKIQGGKLSPKIESN